MSDITRETVLAALAEKKFHPSVPEIVSAIVKITRSPNASIKELVTFIEQDSELTRRMLTIANSGFYGIKHEVTTVNGAIVLMGWNTVKMITLGSTILKRMSERDHHLFVHSIRTANIARFLADEANMYKTEEMSVTGLLHDLGIMIMEMYFNDAYIRTKQFAVDHGVPTQIAEYQLLGVDHAAIGGWVIDFWELPDNIVESVARHHSFDPDTFHARKTAVIHVADILALAVDYSGPSWEKVSKLDERALDVLGFSRADIKGLMLDIMKMRFNPIII